MPIFPSKSDGTPGGWEPQAASGRLVEDRRRR